MRYIPGRGFIQSYRLGPRAPLNKQSISPLLQNIELPDAPKNNYSSVAKEHKIGWNIEAKRFVRNLEQPSLGLEDTAGPAADQVTHSPPYRPDKTRNIVQPFVWMSLANHIGTTAGARKMHSYIQFLTTPTVDTPGTVLALHFDDKRYLIGNIHEGTQRACIQRGQRLLKVSDIFVTGKTEWKNTGGLIGMVLTLADASSQAAISAAEKAKEKTTRKSQSQILAEGGDMQSLNRIESKKAAVLAQQVVQPTLTIHGGPNIMHTLATARRFVFRKGMPVDVSEYPTDDQINSKKDWEPTWSDPRIQVWAMAISPSFDKQDVASPSPTSPRKRLFDEFAERESPIPAETAVTSGSYQTSLITQDTQDQDLRRSVVNEMFRSTWRHDNLIETPLRDVAMPAAIFTRNRDSNKLERYAGPVPDGTTPLPNINVLVRKPWPGAVIDYLPPTKPSSTSMSYIIRNHKQRGKFLPTKAKELKVQEGPLWNKLASGHKVQSMDGVTIEPAMVLEEGSEGAGVAVIDLPSADYVDNLVNRPEWKIDRIMKGVGAIVWLLGPGVGNSKTLKDFTHHRPDMKHVFSSTDYCPNYLSMDSSSIAAIRLHQIDPSHYTIPVHDNTTPQPVLPQNSASPPIEHIQAQRGHVIKTGPSFQYKGTDGIPNLDLAAVLKETPKDVLKLAHVAREEILADPGMGGIASQDLPSKDAEIICLGTGSALPSKYRNVSATLVRVPGYGSYLLDCGENTLGQLKRILSPPELAELLRDLKLIWISHLHADHHLGTASVIKAWYEEVHGKKDSGNRLRNLSLSKQIQDPIYALSQRKNLCVASHINMLNWLKEYSSVEDIGYDNIVPLNCFPAKGESYYSRIEWDGQPVSFSPDIPKMRTAMATATGLSNLVACSVSHCYGAMAVSLTFPNGFKVSYSGDCRPSKAFARIGRDSTVLIHEATFDDELQGDAEAKKHSTTSEAIGVAVAMRAKRVILTHFSQRYQKMPNMDGLLKAEVKLEDAEEVQEMTDGADEAIKATNAMIAAVENMDTQEARNDNGVVWGVEHAIPDVVRPITDQQLLKDMKIGVAFDYLRVKVGEIAQLEKFTPALVRLFEEPVVEDIQTTSPAENIPEGAACRKTKQDGAQSKKGSGKAARRKENKKKFLAYQTHNSSEIIPFDRNAERADRDRAVQAAAEARKLEAARNVEGGEELKQRGLNSVGGVAESTDSEEPLRAGIVQ